MGLVVGLVVGLVEVGSETEIGWVSETEISGLALVLSEMGALVLSGGGVISFRF